MSVLSVKGLSFSYTRENPVLTNVSLDINEGDIVCLLGPNGCGKSTLLTQILFPTPKNKGCIRIFDKPLSEYSLKYRAKTISYVSQKIPSLQLSVLQTVLMGRSPYQKSFFLKPTQKDYDISLKVINELGLSQYTTRRLSTLSGGEIQRVFIAQSLVKEARLYIFDEPMSALDPEYQSDFLSLVRKLSGENAAVIFTSHNPNHLFALKNVKAAIIDAQHRYRELDIADNDDIEKIEKVYNGSIQIKYSSLHGTYMSLFNVR